MRALASLAVACIVLLAAARPTTAQDEQVMLMVSNECAQDVTVLVNVALGSKRETYGWFSVPTGKQQMLYNGGNPVMHNATHPFYIYAKSEKDVWQAQDLRVEWEGQTYNMQQRDLTVVSAGGFPIRLVGLAC